MENNKENNMHPIINQSREKGLDFYKNKLYNNCQRN